MVFRSQRESMSTRVTWVDTLVAYRVVESSVTKVHTHLNTYTKETCYQFFRFEDAALLELEASIHRDTPIQPGRLILTQVHSPGPHRLRISYQHPRSFPVRGSA